MHECYISTYYLKKKQWTLGRPGKVKRNFKCFNQKGRFKKCIKLKKPSVYDL